MIVLKLYGLGYRAFIFCIENSKEKWLNLQLGYSHKLCVSIPSYINVNISNKNTIQLSGGNMFLVTQYASHLIGLKKTNPYSGKGISYENKLFTKKVGKKKTK
uniref:Ribosomal protein L6 n=1 Tax=Gloeochaete wittrockiana TaxID=38269 RepID=A0A096Y6Q7_9EUKA|nr:ribosomal protein L6 [Gloeochaete wittrockiana]AIM52020.1 ribosomal protein L6 [Gloeochaete wittrockiana]